MAAIKSLLKVEKKAIPYKDSSVSMSADYNMDDHYFSIWSYKNGDIERKGTCPQNMQFEKSIAKELRDAFNIFQMKCSV